MELLKSVDKRISRRSYLDSTLDEDTKSQLVRYLEKINEKSGLTFSYVENGGAAFAGYKSYGMFSGVRALLLLKGPVRDAELDEKAGYYGEMAVLFATHLGLGTCWVAGSYDRKSDALSAPSGERLVAVVTIGHVKEQKTVKERAVYAIAHRGSKSIEQLLTSDVPVPDWLEQAMRAVQKAPSARNGQRVSFRYQNGTVTAAVPGGRATDDVDLGIAKLHFELAAGGRFAMGSPAYWRRDGVSGAVWD